MKAFSARSLDRGAFSRASLLAAAGLVLFASAGRAWGQVERGIERIPSLAYYAARAELYSGDYADALRDFQSETRGAIKTPQSSWIDSICYRTMVGECYYHMGNYPLALQNYDAALTLFSAFSDWMIRVKFPPSIPVDTSRMRRQIPWGQSARRVKLGQFPDAMPIGQGRINNNDIVQRGGVVQQAMLVPLNVQEIIRCTSLALRRRRELMGPVCQHSPLTSELVAKLARRPGPPNHWSEAWIDLQLGLAHAGADQLVQAQQFLQRSLVIAGEFDHPLTCVALVELGRLALEAGDFNAAAKFCEEATYSAAYFEDAGVLLDAFHLGQRVHLMANKPGLYPPLDRAMRWAQMNRWRQLEVWLAALTAENYATLGQPQPAVAAVAAARGIIGRRDMASGVIGAQLNYLSALVSFQKNQPGPATEALTAAMAFQRQGSKWIFQISLADHLYANQIITPRTATGLYADLLRDPTAADWSEDPFEALSVLAIPHLGAYERWFDAALQRKEFESALEIADRARRHRFFSSLPFGGRLLSLRAILEAPVEELPQDARLQRQDLLVRYPAYGQLAQQAAAVRMALAGDALVPADEDAFRTQSERFAQWSKLTLSQEGILREMSLRREPANLVFPPLRPVKEIQAGLPEGHAVLVFFTPGRQLHAFLLSRDKYAHWSFASRASIDKLLAGLLREMGNYDPNREISLDEMNRQTWKPLAAQLLAELLTDSKVDLTQGIEELTIVPDGSLWYVPFTALPGNGKPDGEPLLTRMRVRYAPTLGLAVPEPPDRKPARVAAVVGKLHPRDEPSVAQEAFGELSRVVPGTVELKSPLSGPSSIYRALLNGLVVLDDVQVEPTQPYGWSPIGLDRAKPAGALAHWFSLPWGNPAAIILPGYHTAAEDGLRRGSSQPGDELFLPLCGMMAGGTRTILVSRWRMGGQTSFDLVREFIQELPHTTAADAWQRSVMLAMSRPLNWELEPRMKRADVADPPPAVHPLFWSGYLLIDTGAAPRN